MPPPPIESIDHTPPPLFAQGPSARSKLIVGVALALFLMAADVRWHLVGPLRAAVATALAPVQRALRVPVRAVDEAVTWTAGLDESRRAEAQARAQLAAQTLRATEAERLAAENARLRALLELRATLALPVTPAEVLYDAADPYSRKVFIDRGERAGVRAGAPVVAVGGLVGQVTAVYPLSATVTLLGDRDAAVPVAVERTQLRGAAFGGLAGGQAMELRHVATPGAGGDVRVGDRIVTSGLDGVYPPGLLVGRVERIDARADTGAERIVVRPAVVPDGVRHVLVLQPLAAQLPPRPDAAASAASATAAPAASARAKRRPRSGADTGAGAGTGGGAGAGMGAGMGAGPAAAPAASVAR